jgi:hypothetical protein
LPPEQAARASIDPAASVASSTFFVTFTVCPFTVWFLVEWFMDVVVLVTVGADHVHVGRLPRTAPS